MKIVSWKTTVCGCIGMLFGAAAPFIPTQYAALAVGLATVFNGLGHFFARDDNVADYQVGAGNTGIERKY